MSEIDHASQIAAVIGSAPANLVAFYRSDVRPFFPKSRINCIPFERAASYTRKMQSISIVARLGLWVLDDANDSNPFAYISKGPCAGMILHFPHDDDICIAFRSLQNFLDALNAAGREEENIDDMELDEIRVPLDSILAELVAEGSDDATLLIRAYLPICESFKPETFSSLLVHRSFFVREALANLLEMTAPPDRLPAAEQLAADRHSQVADAGKAAVEAIKHRNKTA